MEGTEWFRAREGLRRRTLTRWSAARARAVVTVSEFSRGELVEHLGIRPERIHVIPEGITPPGRESQIPNREAQIPNPESRPLAILYVGSIFNRRHVPELQASL